MTNLSGAVVDVLIKFWEISNEPWGAKDYTSKFIYANDKYKELLNLPKKYDVSGRYDGELPASTSDFQLEFQKHDRQVEKRLDRVTSIEIHPFKGLDYLQPWYFDKFPLIDSTGKCIGTIFYGRPVETIALDKLSKINNQTSLIFTPPSDIFSNREWEILFYILQGYSAKDIARRVVLSHRTVSNHMQALYSKTGTTCRKGLVDYCYEHNIANYVPENFFIEEKSLRLQ